VVETEVIGNGEPTGICGSGCVDFLAEGRRIGLIGRTGRLDANAVPTPADWLREAGPAGRAFRIARGRDQQEITLTEADIARLLQAKAAIAAGIVTLLARVDLNPADVQRVYLAGGFGMHVDPASAIACGLLPGFASGQVHVVGNTALAGAYLALLDAGVLDQMTTIGRELQIVELNLDPGFEACYVEQLTLPD
jgi:uncharacterized 2Fe-2S/4Fe-4S cluster protein (DUF4445 family)